MIIAGMQKTSLLDYPENICSTIFLYGCNFRCRYCHNSELVVPDDNNILKPISEDDVIIALHERKRFIDGVCITGGEPLLNNDLPDFLAKIKKIGLKIKIDTNGTNPELLKKIIDSNLVDYIAMDVKAPLKRYSEIANVKVDTGKIEESIKLILASDVEHEFRTTIVKEELSMNDIKNITVQLKGAKKYVLQQFVADNELLDEEYKNKIPYTPDELREILTEVKGCFETTEIRGI